MSNLGWPWPTPAGDGLYSDDEDCRPKSWERFNVEDREGVVHVMRFGGIMRETDGVRRAEFATVGDACSWFCGHAYVINNRREVVTCISCLATTDAL